MKKRTNSMLAFLLMLAVSLPINATTQLTIFDDGDDYSNNSPINMVYLDEQGSRTQVLYPASVLADMIDEPINFIKFYIADEGITVNGGSVRVSLTETNESSFVNSYFTEGLTPVATISMVTGTKELLIVFDTPFIYHGGNLVVDTYVEETTDYCYSLFEGVRPDYYATLTRGEVSKFIPKTTFDYGTNDDYAAKVLPTDVNFKTVRAGQEDVQIVVLKNIGQSSFTPAFQTEAPFGVISPNVVLVAGESVEVPITFNPQAEGTYNGTLSIDCGPAGVLSVALHGMATQAAIDFVVCDTTDYASFVPIYGSDIDIVGTESQMIYPAEMLTDLVGQEILSLKFHTYKEVQMSGGTIQLSFKIVENTAFASATLVTDLTAVATVSPEYGGMDLVFELDEPYEYNGGNLLVDCKVIEPGVTNYRQTFFYGTPMDYDCGVYKSIWYGNVFEYAKVPFLPMATFSYAKEGPGPAVLRGDVNFDGAVNIADVTSLIDILLGGDNVPDEADCNLDDAVNIADVTTLIDYLLNGNW